MPEWRTPLEKIEIGKGRRLVQGEDLAILSIGQVGNYALDAADELRKEGLNPSVYDMRFVKPLDEEMLHEIFKNNKYIIHKEKCVWFGEGCRASWNQRVAEIAGEGAARDGMQIVTLQLADFPLPMFNQDTEAEDGDCTAVQSLRGHFWNAQGLILGVPEYNGGPPAALVAQNAKSAPAAGDTGPGSLYSTFGVIFLE